MRHSLFFVLGGALSFGCQTSSGDPALGAAEGQIGVELDRAPDGINCMSLRLVNEEGTVRTINLAIFAGVRSVRNVTVGAYDLTATAFRSTTPPPINDGDCQRPPANAPWATQTPVPVI